MNDGFADAKVAGRYAFVKSQQTGRFVYSLYALAYRHFIFRIVVEL